jgi:phosphohistidine phosphatase
LATSSDLDRIVNASPYSTLLVLMRHAHAGWARPGEKDFDRTLDMDGVEEAGSVARSFFSRYRLPEIMLVSPAKRCKMTAETFLKHQPDTQAERTDFQYCERLYTDKVDGYIEQISNSPQNRCLMIIGHNPMMEDTLSAYLTTGTSAFGNSFGYPTAGIAVLGFTGAIVPQQGRLLDFLIP